MHECPDCGSACACDEEDIWSERTPRSCLHYCDGQLDEDDDFDDEEDDD